jgi:tetratricopeptide (TPR) repeat protein
MTALPVHEALSLESLVAEVADEFLARQKRGERPSIDEYARRYPQFATVLGQVLSSLELVQLGSAAGPAKPGPRDELSPVLLGDYRIVREVGRGGMGIVYEARQLSLDRRVALKVLPFAAALDPRQLQRFKNEAQAAAQLHHTNIVPVFGVGCDRGVHFYAMQFIEGRTLAEVIGAWRAGTETVELSSAASTGEAEFYRTVARLGLQAAEALEHAHREGVVHRDIKPANLLADARGNLWVTDFGLARLQNDAGLTVSGDLVGTLRYMSPEQASGSAAAVDHRTDVYSLGATLYELLTLQPAFDDYDRQGLLRKIGAEEPKPLRHLNRAVPVELETIVLKTMAKNPAERYATARDLADDLGRFLKDEPIQARRPTLMQRCRKWARRHRPVVWSAASAALVALAVLAGSVGWVVRDRAALQGKTADGVRAAADEAHAFRREGKLPQARAAARRAAALLDQGGGSAELRQSVRELLADMRMVLRLEEIRILQSSVKDGHFDDEGAGRAYARAFQDYGVDVDALDPLEAAERIGARAIRVELAGALDGWSQTRRWYPQQGRKSWQQLLAVARDADPDSRRAALREALLRNDRQALVEWAACDKIPFLPPTTLVLLAEYLKETRSLKEATKLLRQAYEYHPADFWINHQLAYYLTEKQPPDFEGAVRFYTAAVALRPESPGARLNLGVTLLRMGRRPEALAVHRRLIELKDDYAEAHCNLGRILWEMGKKDEGVAALRRAIALKPTLAPAHGNLGFALIERGQFDEAIAALGRAIALKPAAPELAEDHGNLGHALLERGRLDEAVASLHKALALRPAYPEALFTLGRTLEKKGRLDQAMTAYCRAIALKADYAEAHCNMGSLLGRKGWADEEIAAYRRAIKLKPDLVTAHFNLGLTLTEQGRLDEAITALRRVIELRPAFPQGHYDLGRALWMKGQTGKAAAAYRRASELKTDYAEAHCNLGHCLRDLGEFAPALAAMERGHRLGKQRQGWPYPSAEWVRECRRLVALADKLPAFLRGEVQPAEASERCRYAALCFHKHLNLAAVRLWTEAFTADPELAEDLGTAHRYRAACAAARLGCGRSKDAENLAEDDRAHWRRQALAWLRADLDLRREQLESARFADESAARQNLRFWQWDSELSCLRDPAAVARLPVGEQKAWQQLWEHVQALLARTSADK